MKIKILKRNGDYLWIFENARALYTWLDEVPGFNQLSFTQAEFDAGLNLTI